LGSVGGFIIARRKPPMEKEQTDDIGDQKDSQKIRMIKIPKPGQFRGEGEWEKFDDFYQKAHLTKDESEEYWQELQITGYLPTKEVEADD
jgi:hypothetical protein